MKRKIIKLAEKTLVVSLPTAWVTSQNLAKGDEVECKVEDERLVLIPDHHKSKLSKEISVQGVSERVLRWQISSLHKQGYDEIIVREYDEAQYEILQDLVTHLFIGFIVKEKSKLKIVIGEVSVVAVSEFDAMLRRAFRLLINAFEETQEALTTGKKLDFLMDIEHDNNKVTNFCERLLNKNLIQKEKGHFWYVIAWNLEKILDNFKYVAQEYPQGLKLDTSLMDLYGKTQAFAQGYYECFYDFSYDCLVSLSVLKKELLEGWMAHIKDGKEPVFSHYMHLCVLQIADFSASMIALRDE